MGIMGNGESNVFAGVCPFTFRGGGEYPIQPTGGGGLTTIWPTWGGYPIHLMEGTPSSPDRGYPHLANGGVPHLAYGVGVPPSS